MNNRGVTLIELLTVIALMGIVSAITFLSTGGMREKFRLSGAARQIYGDMQQARLRAIKEGKEVNVNFANDHQYSVVLGGQIIKSTDIEADYRGVTACDFENFTFNANGSAGSNSVILRIGTQAPKEIRVSSTGTGNLIILPSKAKPDPIICPPL